MLDMLSSMFDVHQMLSYGIDLPAVLGKVDGDKLNADSHKHDRPAQPDKTK